MAGLGCRIIDFITELYIMSLAILASIYLFIGIPTITQSPTQILPLA